MAKKDNGSKITKWFTGGIIGFICGAFLICCIFAAPVILFGSVFSAAGNVVQSIGDKISSFVSGDKDEGGDDKILTTDDGRVVDVTLLLVDGKYTPFGSKNEKDSLFNLHPHFTWNVDKYWDRFMRTEKEKSKSDDDKDKTAKKDDDSGIEDTSGLSGDEKSQYESYKAWLEPDKNYITDFIKTDCFPVAYSTDWSDTTAKIYDNLKDQKINNKTLTTEQIAGIMGNMQQESGMNFKSIRDNKTSDGKDTKTFGLCQWEGGRWDKFQDFAKGDDYKIDDVAGYIASNATDKDDALLKAECDYLIKECNEGQFSNKDNNLDNFLQDGVTASQAALYFEQGFERAGTPMLQNRESYANSYAAKLKDYAAGKEVKSGNSTGVSKSESPDTQTRRRNFAIALMAYYSTKYEVNIFDSDSSNDADVDAADKADVDMIQKAFGKVKDDWQGYADCFSTVDYGANQTVNNSNGEEESEPDETAKNYNPENDTTWQKLTDKFGLTFSSTDEKQDIIDYVRDISPIINSQNKATAGYDVGGVTADSKFCSDMMQWAVTTANDDSHGYSQANRNLNPDVDCSSFVTQAVKYACEQNGLDISNLSEISGSKGHYCTTESQRSTYTKILDANGNAVFEEIELNPGSTKTDQLKPGDILVKEGSYYHDSSVGHTEIYMGNNKNVGAHMNYDGVSGDSSGREVSVTDYWDDGWNLVLRYVGNEPAETEDSNKQDSQTVVHKKTYAETTNN